MQHKDLEDGRWNLLSLEEQMANVGSEIERAIKWKSKGNQEYADLANLRALELFDLTIRDIRHIDRLKELTRAREAWLDFFVGTNRYHQTADQWHRYIFAFSSAARTSPSL